MIPNIALPTSPPTPRARPHHYGNHPHLPGATPYANFRASRHDTVVNFEGRQVDRIDGAFRSRMMDRLTHHVHILERNGDSYRLKQSKARKAKQGG